MLKSACPSHALKATLRTQRSKRRDFQRPLQGARLRRAHRREGRQGVARETRAVSKAERTSGNDQRERCFSVSVFSPVFSDFGSAPFFWGGVWRVWFGVEKLGCFTSAKPRHPKNNLFDAGVLRGLYEIEQVELHVWEKRTKQLAT